MRRVKQLLVLLGHVSTVVWIWSLGGAAVVTTAIGWTAQANGMPLGWLILGGFGIAVLSFMAIAAILTKLFPSWATQGTLAPTGEVTATIIPQGGRVADLEGQLKDQEDRNEKLLRALRLTEAERHLAKAAAQQAALEKDEIANQFAEVAAERQALQDRFLPPPPPPEPLNKELVIAIKTYGIPAYEALTGILNNLWEPVRELQCIGKFLPGAWAESTGKYVRDYAEKLSMRLDQGDSGEPFLTVWEDFHRAYGVDLAFWVGRVHYFHTADEDNKARLRKWLPLHDQYYTRVRELGNAPDGERIKGWFDLFDSQCTTHRERLVEAMKPSQPTPDTAGSPNG